MNMSDFVLFRDVYSILFPEQEQVWNQGELEHLTGFCEGDGGLCKEQKKKKNTLDFSYRITQRSLKILQITQKTLHLEGNIYPKPEDVLPTTKSYRLVYTRRDQVLCFIALLHTSFRFSDRRQKFYATARLFLDQHLLMMTRRLSAKLQKSGASLKRQTPRQLYQRTWSLCTPKDKIWYQALLQVDQVLRSTVHSPIPKIDTDGAWLSGFMEAEGTFRCQFYLRPAVKRGYSVALGIEFRQNFGFNEFQVLKDRFGGHLRTEGESSNLRIADKKSLEKLKDYFLKYPLRGRKNINQARWMRAYRLREQNRPLPPPGSLEYRRFVHLFTSVNAVKD